tara:strand:- start:3395 stop:3718 length:324 start_codon:yes stop_codon:yes gene_type:complete
MKNKNKLRALVERSLQTDEPPAYESAKDVAVSGESLSHPIYWLGHQWAVTSYGIEARDGKYQIKRNQVWEGDVSYGLVEHMEEKGWVDMSDFVEALRLARARWPKPR